MPEGLESHIVAEGEGERGDECATLYHGLRHLATDEEGVRWDPQRKPFP